MQKVEQPGFGSIVGNGAIGATPLICDELSTSTRGKNDDKISLIGQESRSSKTDEEKRRSLLWDELRHIIQLAIPVCGTYLLEIMPGMVGIVLVGRIESDMTKEYLDAASLGVMFFVVTGLSIGSGLATAMDTLCSQAYGAKESLHMGIYLQTGLIVLSFAFSIVFVLTVYTTDILIALGQPVFVSQLTGEFTLWLLPGIPFLYLYELLRRVLLAQNIATPALVIAVIANVINIALGYYLVYHTKTGWLGAAIARSVCNIIFGITLVLYVIISGSKDKFWSGWHFRKAMDGLEIFLSLGIPGMLQVCLEYWCFEFLAIMSGWMPNKIVAIGANCTLENIVLVTFMVYSGVGTSGGIRVGNALGEGDPKRASLAAKLTIVLNFSISIVFAIILLVLRFHIPWIYTHDEDVVNLVSLLLIIGASFQIGDACQQAVQGVFRGSGRQRIGAILNFIAFYAIGLPLAAILAFPAELGTYGLWTGISIGVYVLSTLGVVVVATSDWATLSSEAMRRITS